MYWFCLCKYSLYMHFAVQALCVSVVLLVFLRRIKRKKGILQADELPFPQSPEHTCLVGCGHSVALGGSHLKSEHGQIFQSVSKRFPLASAETWGLPTFGFHFSLEKGVSLKCRGILECFICSFSPSDNYSGSHGSIMLLERG